MSSQIAQISSDLYSYMLNHSLNESSILKEIRDYTQELPYSGMQVTPDEGQFLAMLVSLISAKKTLDIGTLTGYSALSVAQALPDDGLVISCDISNKDTEMAREFWLRSGQASKIDLRIAPAVETLTSLIEDGMDSEFDFAFIDADKANYIEYLNLCLILVRVNGLIVVDNTLWSGKVIDAESLKEDKLTRSIDEFNNYLSDLDNVDITILPLSDGLTLVRRKN